MNVGIFISNDPNDYLRQLTDIFPDAVKADKMMSEAKKCTWN